MTHLQCVGVRLYQFYFYITKYIQYLKQVFEKELKYVMKINNDFNDRTVCECRVSEWFIVLFSECIFYYSTKLISLLLKC